jgi:hypothetical protein
VPIYTVFVGPNGAGDTLGSQNLLRLAQATGGQRLIFSGPDSLAPLFQLLSDRGRQYQLTYRSSLSATGQHRLAARVRLPGGGPAVSNEIVFPLRVTAPMLHLGALPPSVVRVAASHDADPATADPAALEVPLTVDFPDGHPRAVRLAQLLVDGQVVVTQTNTSALAPMIWPLAAYAEAGDHQLQARLIDELGLAAESEAVMVNVSLQRPAAPPGPPLLPQVNDHLPSLAVMVALAGLALAAAIGLLAWGWAARRQRLAEAQALEAAATLAARPVVRRVKKAGSGATEPLSAPPQSPTPARPPARLSLPHLARPTFRLGGRPGLTPLKGACYFQVVEPGAGGAARPDIDLTAPHLTLGRDAAVADTVFHDRSVSRLHARVEVQDSRVTIVDQGSTSGTWVNYTPLHGDAGCELRHGDLVNLGRVQLRFLRRDAPPLNGNGARVVPATRREPAPVPGGSSASLPGVHDAGASDKAA